MRAFGLVRGTVMLAVPVGLLAAVAAILSGYPDVAGGVVLGIAGGILKSLLMVRAVVGQDGAPKAFFLRYLLIALVFCGGAYISMPCFFAVVGGLLFTHVVFIFSQIKSVETGDN